MRKSVPLFQRLPRFPPLPMGGSIYRNCSAEISSEDPSHPFENALQGGGGWRAAAPGPQVIRLNFDEPQSIRRIRLTFREEHRGERRSLPYSRVQRPIRDERSSASNGRSVLVVRQPK